MHEKLTEMHSKLYNIVSAKIYACCCIYWCPEL